MFLVRAAIAESRGMGGGLLGREVMDAEVGAVHAQAVGLYCELDRLVQHVARAEHVRMRGLGVEGIVAEAEESEGFHGANVRQDS